MPINAHLQGSKNIGCGACQVIGNFKYTSSLGYTGGEKDRNEDVEQAEGMVAPILFAGTKYTEDFNQNPHRPAQRKRTLSFYAQRRRERIVSRLGSITWNILHSSRQGYTKVVMVL